MSAHNNTIVSTDLLTNDQLVDLYHVTSAQWYTSMEDLNYEEQRDVYLITSKLKRWSFEVTDDAYNKPVVQRWADYHEDEGLPAIPNY